MKYKVLIVDDSFSSRSLLKNIIKKNNDFCELVGEAKNGQEAINMYKQLEPDLITMDLSMPVKNGVEATNEILKMNARAKIVVVTGTTDDSLIEQVKALGIKNVIAKPFQSNALVAVFKDLIAEDGDALEEEEFSISTPSQYKVKKENNVINEPLVKVLEEKSNMKEEPVLKTVKNEHTVLRPIVQEEVYRPIVQEPIVQEPIRMKEEVPVLRPIVQEEVHKPTIQEPVREEFVSTLRPIVKEVVAEPIQNENIYKPVIEPQTENIYKPVYKEFVEEVDNTVNDLPLKEDLNYKIQNELVNNHVIDDEDDDDEYTPYHVSVEVENEEDDDDEYTPPENVFEENSLENNIMQEPIVQKPIVQEPIVQEPKINVFEPISTKEEIVQENVYVRDNLTPVQNMVEEKNIHDRVIVNQEINEVKEQIVEKQQPVYEPIQQKSNDEEKGLVYKPINEPTVHKEEPVSHQNDNEYKEVYKPINNNADEDIIPLPNIGQGVFVPQYEDKSAFELSGNSKKLEKPIHWVEEDDDEGVDEMLMVLPGSQKEIVKEEVKPSQPVTVKSQPTSIPPNTVPNRNTEQPLNNNDVQRKPLQQPTLPTQPGRNVPPPRPDRLPSQPPRPPVPQRNVGAPPTPSRDIAQPPRNPNSGLGHGHAGNYGASSPQHGQQVNPYQHREEQGRNNPSLRDMSQQQQYPLALDNQQHENTQNVDNKGKKNKKEKKAKKEKSGGLFGFFKGLFKDDD